jgi:hypothetical protein
VCVPISACVLVYVPAECVMHACAHLYTKFVLVCVLFAEVEQLPTASKLSVLYCKG